MTSTSELGPISYENWKAALNEIPSQGAFEFPLYTNTHIVGMLVKEYGPYEFINTVPKSKPSKMLPAIVLSAESHIIEYKPPDMDTTSVDYYHGGLFEDELAALVSLCLGCKLKAGPPNRIFGEEYSSRGRPMAWWGSYIPYLLEKDEREIIPNLIGTHKLEDANILKSYPFLTPSCAIALVRAARLYQEAMWIVDYAPEFSWIMLTSAIETAANYWRSEQESYVERLSLSKPDFLNTLMEYGGDDLVNLVAEEFGPTMGSTKKFLDFIIEFLPSPPDSRPNEYAQVSWEKKPIMDTLKKIYNYRSRALHGGLPFPAPMCMAPLIDNNLYAEKPMGAMSTRGGVWVAEDIPIHLHMFEYIVRKVLLKWWSSNQQEEKTPATAS